MLDRENGIYKSSEIVAYIEQRFLGEILKLPCGVPDVLTSHVDIPPFAIMTPIS